MNLEEIYNSEDISMRSFNVCLYSELNDLSSIISYYKEHGTFINIRNCGQKSNKELIEICLKYISRSHDDVIIIETKIKLLDEIVCDLSSYKTEIINNFILFQSKLLSNRGFNVLATLLNEIINIQNISNTVFENSHFSSHNLKNVGKKTAHELDSFFFDLKLFVEKIYYTKSESELLALKNRLSVEETMPNSAIPTTILESNSIFEITNFLISENKIYKDKKNIIFKKTVKIFKDQTKFTLNEIAHTVQLTRERVRQLSKTCLEDLCNRLQFVKNIEDNLFQKYAINSDQNYISVDQDTAIKINHHNNTNFSREFISYVTYVYLSNDFDIIGRVEDVLQLNFSNPRFRHNWNNFYLVKKEMNAKFDFTAFANDVQDRLSQRIDEAYFFNFKSYLLNFIKSEDAESLLILATIAEHIINEEFELFIDLNDDLTFKKNTLKPVSEYALKVLEALGTPSKLEEIYKLIENDYPGITKSKNALRGSLQKTPEIIHFGRNSTYGLKVWELEQEGIKGGTIKDIAYEFLKTQDEPIHIYELLSEVHKYRQTPNVKSILGNLKLDPQNKFTIFNQSFIGIKTKSYHSPLTNLPKFLGKKISTFIKDHNNAIEYILMEKYLFETLNISVTNIRYIIQLLVENKFIFINNQNKLCV